jgi:4-hydroxybenzoate polyprenyltransferase
VNDLADVEVDRIGKPAKPIPAGLLLPRDALVWAALSAGLGLVLAALSGPGVLVAGLGALGCGYLYDLRLSRTALAWLPLALALPIVPIFGWLGATRALPDGLLALVPVAVLAGAGLSIANGLVDLERDLAAGKRTVAVRLGRTGSWPLHAAMLGIAVLAALVLAPAAAGSAAAGLAGAGAGALELVRGIGLALGAIMVAVGATLLRAGPGVRERGWELEAIGTAVMGLGWLAGVATVGRG